MLFLAQVDQKKKLKNHITVVIYRLAHKKEEALYYCPIMSFSSPTVSTSQVR